MRQLVLVAAAATALVACNPPCAPVGTVVVCECSPGTRGMAVCRSSGFTTCDCGGDGGMDMGTPPPDGGMDAGDAGGVDAGDAGGMDAGDGGIDAGSTCGTATW